MHGLDYWGEDLHAVARLYQHGIAKAHPAGYAEFLTQVEVGSETEALYKRLGWEVVSMVMRGKL